MAFEDLGSLKKNLNSEPCWLIIDYFIRVSEKGGLAFVEGFLFVLIFKGGCLIISQS